MSAHKLTHEGVCVVRDALQIGLLAVGRQLSSGCEMDRGDEVQTIALAMMALDKIAPPMEPNA